MTPRTATRRSRARAHVRPVRRFVRAVSAFALVAAMFAIVSPAAAAIADPELAPYRDLARTPAATRILAFTRDVMASHWSATRAIDDSLPDWPGAPPRELYLSLVDGSATRACVGRATAGTLAASLRTLAGDVLAADPRHPPVRRDEVDRLRLVIAFAGASEEVADPMSVDPAREGLRVSAGRRSVAFLPGEARTVAWALRTARRVLGAASVTCSRFPVVVIAEPVPSRTYKGEPSHADE